MANADIKSDTFSKPAEQVQSKGPQDGQRSGGSLDLNSASESEIAEIDMIGKKLAHAIVAQRELGNGFENWEDLQQVPGLDAMKIAELQRAARITPSS